MVANQPLNDDFAGLQVMVRGYTVTGYDTGSNANDGEFFVRLAEGATLDTGATPGVQVLASGDLGALGGPLLLPVDYAPVTPADKAKPVLLSAWEANNQVSLKFSEAVSSSAYAGDFGLPVHNDTLGAQASVASGQNQADPGVVTIALGAGSFLTPDGLYSPGAVAPGSPTGIYVADGTRIVDAAGNPALAQGVGTAVDLTTPAPEPCTVALLLVGGAALFVWRSARMLRPGRR
jgi:hypothetical protein